MIHFRQNWSKIGCHGTVLRVLDHKQKFSKNRNKKKNEVLPERTYRDSETGGGLSGAARIRIYVRIFREGPRSDAWRTNISISDITFSIMYNLNKTN